MTDAVYVDLLSEKFAAPDDVWPSPTREDTSITTIERRDSV